MTKVTIEEVKSEPKPAKPMFPLVAKHKIEGVVVLFSSPKEGTVLHAGKTGYVVGHRSAGWTYDSLPGTWLEARSMNIVLGF